VNRLRATGAAFVVLLAVTAGGGCGPDRSPDREATERMFLETCAPGGADVEVAVCQCAFDRLTADLSEEEIEELDQSVRGVDELPDDVVAAAVECAADPLTPPTPPPPPDESEEDDESDEAG
jgi:hypothetical protein